MRADSETFKEAREHFMARCSICHGSDGRGQTQMGWSLYPRVPDLLAPQTQNLTEAEIHYIFKNGVQLTGMPAWGPNLLSGTLLTRLAPIFCSQENGLMSGMS